MQNLKSFFKNYYHYIFFVLLAFVIVLTNLKIGISFLSNDNYSPELNPIISFFRYLVTPVWRTYRGLGIASETENVDIVRSSLYFVMGFFTKTQNLGNLYYVFNLLVGAFFTGKLIELLLQKSLYIKYSKIGFVFASFIYLSTLWTIWLTYQTITPYVNAYASVPMLVYFLLSFVFNEKKFSKLFLFFSSLYFLSSALIATLAIVDLFFVFLISFVIIFYKRDFKVRFAKFIKASVIILIPQLIWIIPLFIYYLTTKDSVVSSIVNRSITQSIIDLERNFQNFFNTISFYTRTISDTNGSFSFPLSTKYISLDLLRIISFVPVVFATFGAIACIFNKNWKYLIFTIIFLVLVFVTKIDNPPFGSVFTFMQENFSILNQIFRWPISKFGGILLLTVVILASYGFVALIDIFKSLQENFISKVVGGLMLFIFSLGLIYFGMFLFNGDLFSKSSFVSIPTNYYELKDFLKREKLNGRIYYLPSANNNYFRKYKWGFYGSQFLSYIIPNPIVDLSLLVGSKEGEDASVIFNGAINSGDAVKFDSLLSKYNVDYVLVDTSLVSKGFTSNIDWEDVEKMVAGNKQLFKSGDLTLYKVENGNKDLGLLEKVNQDNSNASYFVREKDISPIISLLPKLENNTEIVNGNLIIKTNFKGSSSNYKLTISKEEFDKLPTKVILKNNQIFLYPSFPYLNKLNYETLPFKSYKGNTSSAYYAIDNNIFTKEELISGRSIQSDSSSTHEVVSFVNSKREYDITRKLVGLSVFDCLGERKKLNAISLEKQGNGVILKSNKVQACTYLEIDKEKYDGRITLSFDWESNTSLPGFCIYSQKNKQCLNQEKYILSKNTFGSYSYTFPYFTETDDKISLILYAKNRNNIENTELTLRFPKIVVNEFKEKFVTDIDKDTTIVQEIAFSKDQNYSLNIPILYGTNSYVYNNATFPAFWDIYTNQSNNLIFDISKDQEGVVQKIKNGNLSLSTQLYNPKSEVTQLIFWRTHNIQNIPSSLCISQGKDSNCLYSNTGLVKEYNALDYFNTPKDTHTQLKTTMTNLSYSRETINSLQDLVVMELPDLWKTLAYYPITPNSLEYSQLTLKPIGNPLYSTIFFSRLNNTKNTIVSINNAKDEGWIALTNKGFLAKTEKVSVNGWMQGWDVSKVSDTNSSNSWIFVFYFPNILVYFTYIFVLIEGYILISNLKKYGKQKY